MEVKLPVNLFPSEFRFEVMIESLIHTLEGHVHP